MFRKREKNRVGAAVGLAAVLAMVLAAPAGAVGWGGWGEARELASAWLPRVLGWLGSPDSGGVLKGDHGGSIDPNGCPNGCPKAAGVDRLNTRAAEDSSSRGRR